MFERPLHLFGTETRLYGFNPVFCSDLKAHLLLQQGLLGIQVPLDTLFMTPLGGMEAVYVEPKKTPMTFEEAHDCMRWALKCQIGKEPSVEALALALAKSALETGRWSSIWNSNWGNVKASDTYQGMYTCILLNEILVRNGKSVVCWFAPEGELTGNPAKGGKLIGKPLPVPDGHFQTRMRAYANNWDGVLSYVEFVAGGRYKKAWAALLTGNATTYIRELKQAGYFTADEDVYLKTTASLQREFIAKIKALPPRVVAPPDPGPLMPASLVSPSNPKPFPNS